MHFDLFDGKMGRVTLCGGMVSAVMARREGIGAGSWIVVWDCVVAWWSGGKMVWNAVHG